MRRLALAGTMVAVVLAGCDVDPFCIDCQDEGDGGPVDAGSYDAGGPRFDAGTDAGPEDGGPDGCVEGAPELCNELDDDCDGEVDEGIDTDSDVNNCGGCGIVCSPPHAFGECVAGECRVESCDVGWYDHNGDPADGCEYGHCLPTASDDSLCDHSDNDCDGEEDEDVDFDSDPLNCGMCGRICAFPHASARCESGTCTLGDCDTDFWDIDGLQGNGCEYACTPADPATETCNGRDDDCDGEIDEGDPGGGGSCGSSVGECTTGIEHCVDGAIVCMGGTGPTTELCNGLDDDCDGSIDEDDPEGGRLCGTGVGVCEHGREQCLGGSLVCVGGVGPGTEICNGLDDDCDGSIDEGDPGGGVSCGDDTGACVAGTVHCRGGVLVCEGATGPAAETCNGVDDDCDGDIDEGNPGGGGSCGTDVGACSPGTRVCRGGVLVCEGATGPAAETCNGIDDDCDGDIDEGNPGGGASCGSSTGECDPGTVTCAGGTLVCMGATGPALEVCNGLDDDCDGTADEDFDLNTDVRNCGSCGNVCSFPNAVAGCRSGTCTMLYCRTGFYDLDGMASNGCEYACDFAGSEVCNGRDDDCDGLVDEALTVPSNFCNPNGVCAGTTAECSGASGWTCDYPMTYEDSESTCDGLDNDCDGLVDEPFPLVGTSCNNGELGACFRTGTYVCNAAGDGVECDAPTIGTGAPETCNGIDDDCDGTLDEDSPDEWVRFSGPFGTRWIFAYEASRPDSTATSRGTMTHRPCSARGRLPWTDVTYGEAQAACAAVGGRLCTEQEWERACMTSAGCTWSFQTSCTTWDPNTCNGNDYDYDPGTPGDQDGVLPTGTLARCFANWGGAGGVYDMSGNVEEWVRARSPGVNPMRGGSYNDTRGGLRCTFDFPVAGNSLRLPSVGFRCCRDSAP